MPMVEKVPCLICLSEVNISSKEDTQNSSFLKKDLRMIFILRTLFEVPYDRLEKLLMKNGHPSEWKCFKLCKKCGGTVENAWRMYKRIVEVSRVFAIIKGSIVESVRSSQEKQQNVGITREEGDGGGVWEVIEDTRKLICDYEYSPFSDPFIDGDQRAKNEGCRLRLSSIGNQSSSSSVKLEKDTVIKMGSVEIHDLFDEGSDEDNLEDMKEIIMDTPITPSSVPMVNATPQDDDLTCKWVGCGEKFNNRDHFACHMWKHTGDKKFKCKMCPMAFDRKLNYEKHFRLKHHQDNPSEEPVSTRERVRCTWPGCGKTLLKTMLKGHQRLHKIGKQWLCEWEGCGSKFYTKDYLAEHMRRHTGERPFKCDQCSREFHIKGTLNAHIKNVHGKAETKVIEGPQPSVKSSGGGTGVGIIMQTDIKMEEGTGPEDKVKEWIGPD